MSPATTHRLVQVLDRAQRTGNAKVVAFLEHWLPDKLHQAGADGGAWLDALEHTFDILSQNPSGAMKSFTPQDFDDLFRSLYGYDRMGQ